MLKRGYALQVDDTACLFIIFLFLKKNNVLENSNLLSKQSNLHRLLSKYFICILNQTSDKLE